MLYAFKSWQPYEGAEKVLNPETNKHEIIYKLRHKELFVSVLSPYCKDAIVMFHPEKKESILYEQKDLDRIMTILSLRGIKFITIPITKTKRNENRSFDTNRVHEL